MLVRDKIPAIRQSVPIPETLCCSVCTASKSEKKKIPKNTPNSDGNIEKEGIRALSDCVTV